MIVVRALYGRPREAPVLKIFTKTRYANSNNGLATCEPLLLATSH